MPKTSTSLAIRAALALAAATGAVPAQATPASPRPFGDRALDDGALGAIAGREDSGQLSSAIQSAGVAHNAVGDNVRTGDAKIADNAFQNLSGLSILNVNTGNNVAINAAMNVNIVIHPGQ